MTAADSVVTVTSISVPVKWVKNATRVKKSAKQVKRPKPRACLRATRAKRAKLPVVPVEVSHEPTTHCLSR